MMPAFQNKITMMFPMVLSLSCSFLFFVFHWKREKLRSQGKWSLKKSKENDKRWKNEWKDQEILLRGQRYYRIWKNINDWVNNENVFLKSLLKTY
jgi:hypothetical protein